MFGLVLLTIVSAGQTSNEDDFLRYKPVSIVELLVSPESYDGKRILVGGLVSVGRDDTALYVSKDAFEHVALYERVLLELSKEDFLKCLHLHAKYAMIEADVELTTYRDGGRPRAVLRNIKRCDELRRRRTVAGEIERMRSLRQAVEEGRGKSR